MITTIDKALVAAITGILSLLDLLFNISFGLDQGTIAAVAAVATTILVWLVPNKKPSL